jgi:hypothetical protein
MCYRAARRTRPTRHRDREVKSGDGEGRGPARGCATQDRGFRMLKQWQFVSLTIIALIATALAISNMAMFVQNRDLQVQASSRTQFIQQGAQLQNLYRDLLNVLAELAMRNQDQELRDLLATQGVSLGASPGSPAAAAAKPTNPAMGTAKAGTLK